MIISRDEIVKKIEAAREMKGWSYDVLEEKLGWKGNRVYNFVSGRVRKIPAPDDLKKIFDVLAISDSGIIATPVKVVGYLSGGGAMARPNLQLTGGEFEYVEAPPGETGVGLIAARVVGKALAPVYRDGAIVYLNETAEAVPADPDGLEALCVLENGGEVLGWLMRDARGLHIHRAQSTTLEAAEVKEIHRVAWIKKA